MKVTKNAIRRGKTKKHRHRRMKQGRKYISYRNG